MTGTVIPLCDADTGFVLLFFHAQGLDTGHFGDPGLEQENEEMPPEVGVLFEQIVTSLTRTPVGSAR